MHRDPETGQFMSHDDEPVDLNYSDHEILNFRVASIFGTSTGTPQENIGVEIAVEDDVLDLENDELAMLTWIDSSMSLGFEQFGEFGGEVTRGGAIANAEIGANLADSEYLSQAETSSGMQIVDDDDEANIYGLRADDEPGLWTHLNATASSGFKDADADGNYSGNSTVDNDRMRRVYAEETGGGPYIDAQDDVTIGLYVDKIGTVADLRVTVYGQMSFLIFEYENRRAEFAPYDPGPSMD